MRYVADFTVVPARLVPVGNETGADKDNHEQSAQDRTQTEQS